MNEYTYNYLVCHFSTKQHKHEAIIGELIELLRVKGIRVLTVVKATRETDYDQHSDLSATGKLGVGGWPPNAVMIVT